jgi:transcriptional regulator with XRE-family HTH domain
MTDQILTSEKQAGQTLGKLRRQAGLRQIDLAKRLHYSVDVIRTREQARAMIRLDELLAITDELGYDVVLVARKETP